MVVTKIIYIVSPLLIRHIVGFCIVSPLPKRHIVRMYIVSPLPKRRVISSALKNA